MKLIYRIILFVRQSIDQHLIKVIIQLISITAKDLRSSFQRKFMQDPSNLFIYVHDYPQL